MGVNSLPKTVTRQRVCVCYYYHTRDTLACCITHRAVLFLGRRSVKLVGQGLQLFLPLAVELFLHALRFLQSLLVELCHQAVLLLAVLALQVLLVLVELLLRLAHLSTTQPAVDHIESIDQQIGDQQRKGTSQASPPAPLSRQTKPGL